MADYDTGLAVLRPADMSNRATWEADHNRWTIDEVLARFRSLCGDLVGRLEAISPTAFARTARHPRLERPMRVVDMLFFHAEHDDYHLARITELIRRWTEASWGRASRRRRSKDRLRAASTARYTCAVLRPELPGERRLGSPSVEFTFPNASIFVEESITEHGVGLNVNERQPPRHRFRR